MKKIGIWTLASLFMSVTVLAAVEGPDAARYAHRQDIKKIKATLREAKKNAPPEVKQPSKMDLFWKKEGERSGLGNTGSGAGNFFRNMNPVPFFKRQEEQYNARKAGAK